MKKFTLRPTSTKETVVEVLLKDRKVLRELSRPQYDAFISYLNNLISGATNGNIVIDNLDFENCEVEYTSFSGTLKAELLKTLSCTDAFKLRIYQNHIEWIIEV